MEGGVYHYYIHNSLDCSGHVSVVNYFTSGSSCSASNVHKGYALEMLTALPSAPSTEGYLEKWYRTEDCTGSISGWFWLAFDACFNDKLEIIAWYRNPGHDMKLSAGMLYPYSSSSGQCTGYLQYTASSIGGTDWDACSSLHDSSDYSIASFGPGISRTAHLKTSAISISSWAKVSFCTNDYRASAVLMVPLDVCTTVKAGGSGSGVHSSIAYVVESRYFVDMYSSYNCSGAIQRSITISSGPTCNLDNADKRYSLEVVSSFSEAPTSPGYLDMLSLSEDPAGDHSGWFWLGLGNCFNDPVGLVSWYLEMVYIKGNYMMIKSASMRGVESTFLAALLGDQRCCRHSYFIADSSSNFNHSVVLFWEPAFQPSI
jgi:hypothetical protein